MNRCPDCGRLFRDIHTCSNINPMLGKKRKDLSRYNSKKKGKSFSDIYGEERAQEIIIKYREVKLGKNNSFYGKKHSPHVKEIISKANEGKNNHSWQGGITPKLKKEISSTRWKKIRLIVLERDKYICQRCSNYADTVDHKIPWRISHNSSVDNAQALCRSCNTKKMHEDLNA